MYDLVIKNGLVYQDKNFYPLTVCVKGEKIVLIDDIYTTGSTLDEAARVLKKAGAENVYFLTVSIGQVI